jgi:hypothetical protein
LPKSLSQFQKARTIFDPDEYVLDALNRIEQNLFVSKPHDPPTKFLKCNRTGQVFVDLHRVIVRCPVHLDHDFFTWESKVHNAPEMRKWIFDSVGGPQLAEFRFKGGLGGGPLHIEVVPVSKEAQFTDYAWAKEELKRAAWGVEPRPRSSKGKPGPES